ncbi:MAG: hypothetical protein ACJ74T_19535 [Pyrinomonadaceae bacterium]
MAVDSLKIFGNESFSTPAAVRQSEALLFTAYRLFFTAYCELLTAY